VFLWSNLYFEWDIFKHPRAGLELLEVEVDAIDGSIQLPPFLSIEREVTQDKAYANHTIALK
jgi:CYTH domain-containing protein